MAADLSIPASGFRADLYYWLATVLHLTYWGEPAQRERVLQMPGPCTWELVQPVHELDPPAFIIADYGNWLLIAVEGTSQFSQWVGDFLGVLLQPTEGAPGAVHTAFGIWAQAVWSALLPKLPSPLGGRRILLAGDSMGAAVAQILAWRLLGHYLQPVHAVVCLGSPRVGNAMFARSTQWRVIRLENINDIVPQLPPGIRFNFRFAGPWLLWDLANAYEHAGQGFRIGLNGAVGSSLLDLTWNNFLDTWVPDEDADSLPIWHGAPNYLLQLRRSLPRDASTQNYPIGYIPILDEINVPRLRAEGVQGRLAYDPPSRAAPAGAVRPLTAAESAANRRAQLGCLGTGRRCSCHWD